MPSDMPSFREVVNAMKASGVQHHIFEITGDGSCTFHGYTVAEVEQLLKAYRDHMVAFARIGQEIQSGLDAVRYQPGDYSPVGPEDV